MRTSALGLLTALAFLPSLQHGFIAWDDDVNFLENPDFRGLGWANIRWAWTTFHLEVYQPLSWIVLELQYLVFGLDARGYHLTSLIWHAVNTILLFGLSVDLLERVVPETDSALRARSHAAAALAAALWGVHPLRVEVVAWASCQCYLPCACFLLLALRAYLRANPSNGTRRTGWLILASLLGTGSMLSKAPGMVVPALFLILDVYPLRRLWPDPRHWLARSSRDVWLEKIPLLIFSVVVAVLAVKARGHEEGLLSGGLPELSRRLAKSAYSVWFYPLKSLAPLRISPYYPLPRFLSITQPLYGASLVLAVGVTVAAILGSRKWTGLTTLWFAYLVFLFPFMATTNMGHNLVADRYSYLPTIPWSILLAWLVWRLMRQGWTLPLMSLTALLWLALAGLSLRQCEVWENTDRLFREAFALGGQHDPLILGNLGADRLEQGDLAGAERLFREALLVAPDDHISQFNLGLVQAQSGRLQEAIKHLRRALELRPNFAEARFRLGEALIRTGRESEGQAELAAAIRIDPSFVAARVARADWLARRGRLEEAISEYREASKSESKTAGVHLALGLLLARTGRQEGAIKAYHRALELEPDRAETHAALGTLLARQGRLGEAIAALRTSVRLDPGNADAHANLAVALAQKGDPAEAEVQARAAVKIRPDHPGARRLLAALAGKK